MVKELVGGTRNLTSKTTVSPLHCFLLQIIHEDMSWPKSLLITPYGKHRMSLLANPMKEELFSWSLRARVESLTEVALMVHLNSEECVFL